MPGLLAQVPAAEAWAMLESPAGSYAAPADPRAEPSNAAADAPADVPSNVRPVERPTRSRLPWWQLVAAAVLVAVLGGLGGYGVRGVADRFASQRLAFEPVAPSSLTAVVDLAPVSGGPRSGWSASTPKQARASGTRCGWWTTGATGAR